MLDLSAPPAPPRPRPVPLPRRSEAIREVHPTAAVALRERRYRRALMIADVVSATMALLLCTAVALAWFALYAQRRVRRFLAEVRIAKI